MGYSSGYTLTMRQHIVHNPSGPRAFPTASIRMSGHVAPRISVAISSA
ncbi:hypothetical protein L284_17500 [Novosphingobium lindaniclasticum LE124]|uniref:Uncharacterized protein n=1 Tax=Novosphingobium lindaniclasticum LE124 TaxID=1096930 RepID=T0IL40_9SPHN|nr:hypothetical protein L284_17500 [Novosphingobium lindaniclasticum LE124]